jgi:hypothetical protein
MPWFIFLRSTHTLECTMSKEPSFNSELEHTQVLKTRYSTYETLRRRPTTYNPFSSSNTWLSNRYWTTDTRSKLTHKPVGGTCI